MGITSIRAFIKAYNNLLKNNNIIKVYNTNKEYLTDFRKINILDFSGFIHKRVCAILAN